METHLVHRRSSWVSGCMMSPSCFPVSEEMGYSSIHSSRHSRRSWRWRKLLRRFLRDSTKHLYGPRPSSFHYDAVSYAQNFDEGFRNDQVPGCHSIEFHQHVS
ncbi:hypothetical protein I3760_07G041700 [Carya illinoinensis]|uniref:Uncharacterized protein n=1 Tax=Carya illinoinensis TaxID=32201 RepID=A0A922EII3_CARIL|nr:hypothetical protein I3760_07G041700 [Carya illinoinensis]KAG6702600.1 hypothetical protein I3842_07G043100 [Carya illinoinensis]